LRHAAIFWRVSGAYVCCRLTLKKENIQPFMARFEDYVHDTITEEQLVPRLFIDAELSFSEINEDFFKTMSQFQPFGPETCPHCLFHEMYLIPDRDVW